MNPRIKTILAGAATVVVLAGVIVGLWAFTSPKKPTKPPTIQLSAAQQSQQAYQQGMSALSSEETSTAVALFRKAVTLDPTNTDAKTALDNSTQATPQTSTKPSQGSATKPASTPVPVPNPNVWTQKLDIKTLLPKSFPDYALGTIDAAGSDAVVAGSPTKPNAPVTSIVWSLHDRTTTADAATFVTKVSKSLYPHNATKVTVNGVPGYFGTDGVRFATLTFTRGRYVFEVVMSSTTPPAGTQGLAEQAAAAFATAP
jgi:hypothetical protein